MPWVRPVRQQLHVRRDLSVRSVTILLALAITCACGRAPSVEPTPTPPLIASASASPTCKSTVLPPPRFGAAGAFDENLGAMVIFGGDGLASTTTGALASIGDTWLWKDGCWSSVLPEYG